MGRMVADAGARLLMAGTYRIGSVTALCWEELRLFGPTAIIE